jgi:hypothetical protein
MHTHESSATLLSEAVEGLPSDSEDDDDAEAKRRRRIRLIIEKLGKLGISMLSSCFCFMAQADCMA